MRREVKIGIFAVGMIACLWAGIRFLSGIDIFSRNTDYYAAYDQINGVQPASPIMIRGVKVGTVTGISFDPAVSDNVVLRFSIKRQYRIPVNSEAKIFSNGIMGSKAIEILLGDADRFLVKGDTLRTSRDRDLMDVAGSELEFFKQKVSTVVADLSQTLGAINGLIETNAASVRGTLAHLNSISGSVDGLLAAERDNLQLALRSLTAFSDMLGSNTGRMDSVIRNVNDFTAARRQRPDRRARAHPGGAQCHHRAHQRGRRNAGPAGERSAAIRIARQGDRRPFGPAGRSARESPPLRPFLADRRR